MHTYDICNLGLPEGSEIRCWKDDHLMWHSSWFNHNNWKSVMCYIWWTNSSTQMSNLCKRCNSILKFLWSLRSNCVYITPREWCALRYSTNHVYLHRPNVFGFWQPRLHMSVLRNTQTRFELFWIGLRIRNAFGMNRNCTFCVCLFSKNLICDLWALCGFRFIKN